MTSCRSGGRTRLPSNEPTIASSERTFLCAHRALRAKQHTSTLTIVLVATASAPRPGDASLLRRAASAQRKEAAPGTYKYSRCGERVWEGTMQMCNAPTQYSCMA